MTSLYIGAAFYIVLYRILYGIWCGVIFSLMLCKAVLASA